MADQNASDHHRAFQHPQHQQYQLQQHPRHYHTSSPSPSRHPSANPALENPHAPVFPAPNQNPVLHPRSVYLRDHVSIATVHPVIHVSHIPGSLVAFLCTEFNNEIARGDTYPFEEPMSLEKFKSYWFGTFGAVMLLGGKDEHMDLLQERDWATQCLGTFYVKSNYPGRSSHICNAGFLTTYSARGKGCGKHLGEAYLDFAPKLGYTYSMFNLVYETNTASCKIWDSLGFKRIGKVKGAGRLNSSPYPVDAIIYGRDLNDDEDYVSDERFDKIRFYLEKGKYPPTADRSEKSRLRSAATHYKLENGKLMLKDKEVVSDGQMQYEIARSIHCQSHGGINKTTASIAEKFHWVRIKETVSQVIRNCAECKEHAKAPVVKGDRFSGGAVNTVQQQQQTRQHSHPQQVTVSTQALLLQQHRQQAEAAHAAAVAAAAQMDIPVDPAMMDDVQHNHHIPHQFAPVANMRMGVPHEGGGSSNHNGGPIGPQSSQNAAAVAAARAALGEGDDLTEEDRTMRDQQLMDRLMAEMKREPGPDITVPYHGGVGNDESAVAGQLREDMDIER